MLYTKRGAQVLVLKQEVAWRLESVEVVFNDCLEIFEGIWLCPKRNKGGEALLFVEEHKFKTLGAVSTGEFASLFHFMLIFILYIVELR